MLTRTPDSRQLRMFLCGRAEYFSLSHKA